ncbi:MAG: hypothetical protein GEU79_15965 [Acidimicrobiia bacterium]|nr:hypothetical protein [Acidimicrobiia bacterium]
MTIRSSIWNIASQTLSPLILIFIGVSLKAGRPGWFFPLLWIGAGVFLGVAAFWWLPIAARFDDGGITRVFLFRREHLDWREVAAMTRTKTGFTFRTPARRHDDTRMDILTKRGGESKKYRGRAPADKHRRWGGSGIAAVTSDGAEKVLTERLETQDQHEMLRDLTRKHAPDADWRVTAPGSLLSRG